MPSVSYVVPLYNKERFLPYVLGGLAAQTGSFDRQYIFVDDGSTDGTLESLKRHTADWPNVRIIAQKNTGPAIASNNGFAAAEGDFIKPVDGDDILLPWATEYLLDATQRAGSDAAFANGRFQAAYSLNDSPAVVFGKATKPAMRWEREENSLRLSLHSSRSNPTMWLARAQLVREVGGCDEAIFIQDYSIELRLAAAGPLARVDALCVLFPEAAPGRLTDNQAQILHDVNLALIRFVQDRGDLLGKLRRYAMRRAAGRTWAWATRRGGKSVLSRPFALHAAALFGCLTPSRTVTESLCAPFRETSSIRLMADRTR